MATLRPVGADRVEVTTIRRIAQMTAAAAGFIARCFRDRTSSFVEDPLASLVPQNHSF